MGDNLQGVLSVATLLFISLMYLASSASGQDFLLGGNTGIKVFQPLVRDMKKEIVSIKQPLTETLVNTGSSQCSNVKNLLGVAYEQMEGENEPDVNRLTLEFDNRAVHMSFNITAAAREIPLSQIFKPQEKLVIFVHGFIDNPSGTSFRTIRDAFLDIGHNVLALDGSSLIGWLYLRSSTYVRFMGEKLGEVLAAMVHSGVDPSNIHILGHSLGSHISGFAGKTFTELTGLQIGRISGLDPAGPCFSHIDPDLRLKASDATFVDVMHTDAGVYGLRDPVGHVDFFPNSGSEQPGCLLETCSHLRTWAYYAESVINPQAFPARKCYSWDSFKKDNCDNQTSYMGYPCTPGTTGLYYLQTRADSPYGKGSKGLKFNNNEGVVKTVMSNIVPKSS